MSAANAWAALSHPHTTLVARAEVWSRLTDRSVLVPEGELQDPNLVNEFTSWSARGVANLANKLAVTLFDPRAPAFRLEMAPELQAELAKTLGLGGEQIASVESSLAYVERRVVAGLTGSGMRPKLIAALLHLIVTGNVLLDLRDDDGPVLYTLKEFRCKRKRSGKLIEVVVRTVLKKDELEDDVRAYADVGDAEEVTHYQWAQRLYDSSGPLWRITQWLGDVQLPDEFTSTYMTDEEFPWALPTWSLPVGRHYGRGLGEQCREDFYVLAQLSEAEAKGLVAAAEVRWGVDPTGITNIADVEGSKSGDFIPARPGDINPIGLPQWQVGSLLKDRLELLKRDLGAMLLMYSSMVRDAERVTREEIVQLVREFEGVHAGVHAHIAPGLMTPIIRLLLRKEGIDLTKAKQFRLRITTGFEALGRAAEMDRQAQAVQMLTMWNSAPAALQQRLKWPIAVAAVDTAIGSNVGAQLMSEQEFGAMQQRLQQAATSNQVAIKQAGTR